MRWAKTRESKISKIHIGLPTINDFTRFPITVFRLYRQGVVTNGLFCVR